METVRAFIAIDIGAEVRNRLAVLQNKLRNNPSPMRWVKPDNMHLTLAFFARLSIDKIPDLSDALDRVSETAEPFEIRAVRTGFFGSRNHPKVIWAGLEESPALISLRQQTTEAILQSGITFDSKSFHPHLTLGRFKESGQSRALLEKIEHWKDAEFGTISVKSLELIKSELKPGGAEHTVLHQSRLG